MVTYRELKEWNNYANTTQRFGALVYLIFVFQFFLMWTGFFTLITASLTNLINNKWDWYILLYMFLLIIQTFYALKFHRRMVDFVRDYDQLQLWTVWLAIFYSMIIGGVIMFAVYFAELSIRKKHNAWIKGNYSIYIWWTKSKYKWIKFKKMIKK